MADFEEIYKKHFSDVYRYILKLSGDQYIAEEITSETFLKAIKSIDSFRGDCEIRVWLCQIAKNCYFSYIKKHTPDRNGELDEAVLSLSEEKSLSDRVQEHSEALRVQKILLELGDPYKDVFMWRFYAELSFKEIGALYGKSENWACVTYHRTRKMIKERLEAD